jgi:hypothetical protein
MLRSAAVEGHGRSACRRAAIGVILVAATCAISSAQTPPPADLVAEIVARVVAVVPAGSPLSIGTGAYDQDEIALGPAIQTALLARGYRRAPAGTIAVTVEIDCGENLRERVCALVVGGETLPRTTTFFRRPHARASGAPVADLSLQLRPLLSQRTAILDVQPVGDRLLVLDATGLTLHERADSGWRPARAAAVSRSQPWPRDLRGRLQVDGERVEVFLPGLICTATLALQDLACRNARGPWPLGIANTGLDPLRNVFATPEGLTFLSAAYLPEASGEFWLVATGKGILTLLDPTRTPTGTMGAGDDIAAILDPCRSNPYALIRQAPPGGNDDRLALFSVPGRLLSAAAPLTLPGRVTALWADRSSMRATVVVHSATTGQYEASDIHIACTR